MNAHRPPVHTTWLDGTRLRVLGLAVAARSSSRGLMAMRFRENADGTGRLLTVEPLVERALIQNRDDSIVSSSIKPEGIEVRRLGQFKEVRFHGKNLMWTQADRAVR